MKKTLLIALLGMAVLPGIFANGAQENISKPIVVVWYPNESGEEMKGARCVVDEIVHKATGRKVIDKLTTDYNIAIETMATNNGAIAFPGAQGYIEAHNKNPNVLPLVTTSGPSGTLNDAVYYSWIAVRSADASRYLVGGKYDLEQLQGKRFSWVSTSSTSGFKVPSKTIIKYFSGKGGDWARLKPEDLLEGGQGKFFSLVLFGQSHQGTAVNLLAGRVDAATFNNINTVNYSNLVSGTQNMTGAVYRVSADAAEPFNTVAGQTWTVIASSPVLNAPFVVNTNFFTREELQKLREGFMSEEVTNNPKVFTPKGSSLKGLFEQTGKVHFVPVNDAWYNPIRELSR